MISLTPFLGGPEVASTLAAAPTPDDVTQVWHISTAAVVAMRVGEEMGDHDWSFCFWNFFKSSDDNDEKDGRMCLPPFDFAYSSSMIWTAVLFCSYASANVIQTLVIWPWQIFHLRRESGDRHKKYLKNFKMGTEKWSKFCSHLRIGSNIFFCFK